MEIRRLMGIKNYKRQWMIIDDCNVAYRQWGKEGKPVVLLHGLPMNSSLWNSTGLQLSSSGYQVYAPEMLGLGYTEGPLDYDHSLLGQAKLLNQFINKAIQDDYLLVGHDLGGGVAQIIMTELTQRIKKCVLTNCVAFDSWPIEGVKNFLIKAAYRKDYSKIFTSEFILNFLKIGVPAGLLNPAAITNELLKDIQQGLAGTKERTDHFVEFLKAMDNKYTRKASPELKKFKGPALIVWAQEDKFQPVHVGERLRDTIPNADWKLIKGGHFHPLENNKLAETIIEWDKS